MINEVGRNGRKLPLRSEEAPAVAMGCLCHCHVQTGQALALLGSGVIMRQSGKTRKLVAKALITAMDGGCGVLVVPSEPGIDAVESILEEWVAADHVAPPLDPYPDRFRGVSFKMHGGLIREGRGLWAFKDGLLAVVRRGSTRGKVVVYFDEEDHEAMHSV